MAASSLQCGSLTARGYDGRALSDQARRSEMVGDDRRQPQYPRNPLELRQRAFTLPPVFFYPSGHRPRTHSPQPSTNAFEDRGGERRDDLGRVQAQPGDARRCAFESPLRSGEERPNIVRRFRRLHRDHSLAGLRVGQSLPALAGGSLKRPFWGFATVTDCSRAPTSE